MGISGEDENVLAEPNYVKMPEHMGKMNVYANIPTNEKGDILLETDGERGKRRFSLWIIYLTVFVQCLGASVVITGMWPYLRQLDKDATKKWFGAIVGANPLGQLIFSPLIGWWCIRGNSIRIPSLFCLGLFIVSNIWFALLPLAEENVKYYMFISRFLVGVSSGSMVACRTFITQGTLMGERTAAVSYLSLFQSLGFILGPAVQVALTPLGETGIGMGIGSEFRELGFNMYTASGWVAAGVGLVNLVLYHPKLFGESDIAMRETLAKRKMGKSGEGKESKEVDWSKFPPDYFGLSTIFYTFFVVFFCYSLMETLATPVTIDQFGWSDEEAIRKVGMATALSSLLALACFLTIPPLCRRLDERKILLGLGMVPMVLGRLFFFPYGGVAPPNRIVGCVNSNGSWIEDIIEKEACQAMDGHNWVIVQNGCPPEQGWCSSILALNVYLLAIGYAVCTIGYPYTVVMPQTLFSKMLGARPQGVWMGALTAVTSLARVVGPIVITYTYTNFGTITTSGVALAVTLVAVASQVIVYKKLVPFKFPDRQ